MNCHPASWDLFEHSMSRVSDQRKMEATHNAFSSYHEALNNAYTFAPDVYERLRTESRRLEKPSYGSVTAVKLQSILGLFNAKFRNVLDVGAAPGYMTEFFYRNYPNTRILMMSIQSEMVKHIGERSKNHYEGLKICHPGRIMAPENDPQLVMQGYDGNASCRCCMDMAKKYLKSKNMTEKLLVISDVGLDKYRDSIDGQLIGAILLQKFQMATMIIFKVQTPFDNVGNEKFLHHLQILESLATLAQFKLRVIKPFGSWRCNDELYYVAYKEPQRVLEPNIVDQVLHYYAVIGGEKKAFAEYIHLIRSSLE